MEPSTVSFRSSKSHDPSTEEASITLRQRRHHNEQKPRLFDQKRREENALDDSRVDGGDGVPDGRKRNDSEEKASLTRDSSAREPLRGISGIRLRSWRGKGGRGERSPGVRKEGGGLYGISGIIEEVPDVKREQAVAFRRRVRGMYISTFGAGKGDGGVLGGE